MTRRPSQRLLVVALLLSIASTGCAAVMAANQPGKKDLQVLEASVPRHVVTAELGKPKHSVTDEAGRTVDYLDFSQGYSKKNRVGRTLFHLFADTFTMGAWEVVGVPIEYVADGTEMTAIVVYDEQGLVAGASIIEKGEVTMAFGQEPQFDSSDVAAAPPVDIPPRTRMKNPEGAAAAAELPDDEVALSAAEAKARKSAAEVKIPTRMTLKSSVPPAASAEWPDLRRPLPGAKSGAKDAALIIAIDDYALAQDIPGAWQNALDWKEWFKRARGVKHVRVLRNQQATRESVLPVAAGMARLVKPGGRMWLVFIGHGAPSAKQDDGLLVLWDAQQTAASIEARSVAQLELLKALSGSQTHTVAVIDACFSGRTSRGDLAPGLAPLKVIGPSLLPRTTILTAAATNEYAGPLSDGRRPAFSYLVLGALRGWGDADGNGKVSSGEAVAYAEEALTMTVMGNRMQTPSHAGKDLILGQSGGETGPDLTELGLLSQPAKQIVPRHGTR